MVRFGLGLAATAAAVAFLLAAVAPETDAICKNFGKKCDQTSPCCNGGYCDAKPGKCADGCDPENSFERTSCYPRPACVNFSDDFGDKKKLVLKENYDGNPTNYNWVNEFTPDHSSINGVGNLQLDLKYNGDKPNSEGKFEGFGATVTWTRLLEYGKVTAIVKSASQSPGVVSSFITRSQEGDEIDFEWVGKNPNGVEANYYYKEELDYTKGSKHDVGVDTSREFREYAIEWRPDAITWHVDGRAVRTAYRENATREADGSYKFPNKMSRVQFSVWDGGMKAKGTADWAGSPTNWEDKARIYSMYVKSIKIECQYPNATDSKWPPAGYGPKPKTTPNPKGPYVPSAGDGETADGSAAPATLAASIGLGIGLIAAISVVFAL